MLTSNGRKCGILLHPTSLPNGCGIGDLGQNALDFVSFLAEAGQSFWQILPLGPTGPSNSPYSAFSSFAGNPLLICLQQLVDDGLLASADLPQSGFPQNSVDFERVRSAKSEALETAFRNHASIVEHADFVAFREAENWWLRPYSTWQAFQERFATTSWQQWPREIAVGVPEEINKVAADVQHRIDYHDFTQFLFAGQWGQLKRKANESGIKIVGDIPFYAANESADVWAAQDCFRLNEESRRPDFVAGVPPDCFSQSGQLWGNPIFDWEHLANNRFSWWVQRFRRLFSLVDIVRIDHFRGFQAYWQVPASEKTAIHGEWVTGPGHAFFESVRQQLGDFPVWAEDLGMITAEVDQLRRGLGFPGMKVLQFAFDGDPAANPHRPEWHEYDSVVYTGTHDNNTTRGWWQDAPGYQHDAVAQLASVDVHDGNVANVMIEMAMKSESHACILPLQDVLNLGSDARMNVPGLAYDNWGWRCSPDSLTHDLAMQLRQLTEKYNRL